MENQTKKNYHLNILPSTRISIPTSKFDISLFSCGADNKRETYPSFDAFRPVNDNKVKPIVKLNSLDCPTLLQTANEISKRKDITVEDK